MTWKLYEGECSAVMAEKLPDESIDLTVTSPPYDAMRTYNGFTLDWRAVIKELYRVTAVGGIVVWIVADQTKDGGESMTSFEQALFARDCGFNQETMIYQQAGTGAKGSNYYYWQAFEFMFVWVKGQPKTSNLIKDRLNKTRGTKTSGERRKQNGQKKETKIRPVKTYGRRTNIWRPSRDANDNHPAPFPESLAHDHIISWSNPGDVVLDCFVGSGTTGKMAVALERDFIGIDISGEYLEIARKRIESTRLPLFQGRNSHLTTHGADENGQQLDFNI